MTTMIALMTNAIRLQDACSLIILLYVMTVMPVQQIAAPQRLDARTPPLIVFLTIAIAPPMAVTRLSDVFIRQLPDVVLRMFNVMMDKHVPVIFALREAFASIRSIVMTMTSVP